MENMSRSYRKTPITGTTTAKSEKKDKRIANRRYRRKCDQALRNEEEMPVLNEVSNVWEFAKDGKSYYYDKTDKYYKQIMRK